MWTLKDQRMTKLWETSRASRRAGGFPPTGLVFLQALRRHARRGARQAQLARRADRLQAGRLPVRLPDDWTGVDGKIADAFNDLIELNERLASELSAISRVVGKEGKHHAARLARRRRAAPGRTRIESVNALIDDLVHPTSEMARVIGAVARRATCRRRWRSRSRAGRCKGEFLRTAQDRQHDGGPARLVRLGSDARGARGGHRGQARRPGGGEGRRRHVEGPDRQRELHGRQPDGARCATSPR